MADTDDIEGGGGAGLAPGSGGNVLSPRSGGGGYSLPPGSGGSGSGGGLYDSTGKARGRTYRGRGGYSSLLVGATGGMSDGALQKSLALLTATVVLGALAFPLQTRILWLVYGAVVFGALVSMWLSKNVLSCDDGTPEMRGVVRLVLRCACLLLIFILSHL